MLLQAAAPIAAHPLSGTVADWMWLVPILPLAGFVINGLLSIGSVFRRGAADPALHHADHGDTHDGHTLERRTPLPGAITHVEGDVEQDHPPVDPPQCLLQPAHGGSLSASEMFRLA